MNFWTAVVVIVAIGAASEMYRARIRTFSSQAEASFKEFADRLCRVEERLANLETIVLNKERAKRFDELGQ